MATERLMKLVMEFEGYRENAYWDSYGRVWTVGFGETKGVTKSTKMPRAEAEKHLAKRLDEFQAGVLKLCDDAQFTQNQLDAMTCLAYNIGLGNFAKSSVLRYGKRGEHRRAAEAFKLWNKAGGVVLKGLVRRRDAEAELYWTL